jgi:cysteinylglycine-S-conjugate dipeptidase
MHAATLRAFGGNPPVGLKVIIEGEEETGGGSLEHFVAANPDQFAADAIVIADSGNVKIGDPTLTTTLRGMVATDLTIETLQRPVHSGVFGGAAPDALTHLIAVLATLHNPDGSVAVDGLAGRAWDGLQIEEAEFRESAGVLDGVDLVGPGTIADRVYTNPAITVIGIDAPDVATAGNAVVPRARARISLRLAPGDSPASAGPALKAHLEKHLPPGVKATIEQQQEARPFEVKLDGPSVSAAVAAMGDAYGKPAVQVGSGGSIPLVTFLAEVVPQAEIIIWGAEDADAAIHSANERVDLAELERASLAQALFLQRLGNGG